MDPRELNGKRFAFLLVSPNDDGEEEWAVLTGTARVDGTTVSIDRGPGKLPVDILPEWWERVRVVPENARATLLNAEVFLTLTVGNLREGADVATLQKTGLKWPEE